MPKVKIVTGFVPIKGHTRRAEEYGRLSDSLFRGLNAPLRAFYAKIEQCWLWNYANTQPFVVRPCEGDNPQKNSLAYHCVNHNKPEWLSRAAQEDDEADTFVWIDYGAAHQIGVIPEVVNAFISRVGKGDFAAPGCWDEGAMISQNNPCWRFCGSLLIVPREHVEPLKREMMADIKQQIATKRMIDWEVNSLSRVEKRLGIRVYKGNHDASQFTNYRAPDDASFSARLGTVGEQRSGSEGVVSGANAA